MLFFYPIYKMETKKIPFKSQPVNKGLLKDALYTCYENIAFSTFPYLKYNLTSSAKTLEKYNSGNCIALSMFLKRFLKSNYNVNAYLIPTSVPSIFRVEGTPELCHVSVLVPLSKDSYYIMDPAFYFLEPIFIDSLKPSEGMIESMNIHTKQRQPIYFSFDKQNNRIKCYFDEPDPWYYYPIEVLNPDEDIGCHFIKHKPQPFLCKTHILSNGDVYKKYHLKVENGNFIVLKDQQEVYNGHENKVPADLKRELQIYLYKYFKSV